MIRLPELVSATHYFQGILKQVHNDTNLTQHTFQVELVYHPHKTKPHPKK